MKFAWCLCVLVLVTVLVTSADAKRTSSGRKPPSVSRFRGRVRKPTTRAPIRSFRTAEPTIKPRKPSLVNSHFLDSERAATTHGVITTHKPSHRTGSLVDPSHGNPGHTSPVHHTTNLAQQNHTKGPIGFEHITLEVKNDTRNIYTPSAPPLPIGFSNVNQQGGVIGHQTGRVQAGSSLNHTVNQQSAYPNLQSNLQGGYLNQPGVQPNQQGGYINQPAVQPNQQGSYINQPAVQPNPQGGYINPPVVQPIQQGGYINQPAVQPNPQGGYINQFTVQPNPQGGYINQPAVQPNQQFGYINQPTVQPNQQGGYISQPAVQPNQQFGYVNQPAVQPNQQGGYVNRQGGNSGQPFVQPIQQGNYPNLPDTYPNHHGSYSNQPSSQHNQPNGYYNQPGFQPNQQANYYNRPGSQSYQHGRTDSGPGYPVQQNFGYSNIGGHLGIYQGQNQGFGTIPNIPYGSSSSWGYPSSSNVYQYGGSSFGQSNPYGGNPFAYTSNIGSSGYVNPYYNPNTFGYSSNPGFFGSQSTYPGYAGTPSSNYGYHKRSRFSGLPIPIPIPIPIGEFGDTGAGFSHIHRLLRGLLKNDTLSSTSKNVTTSVFILNNSTVTPCTTDLFIYESLNITVTSCTAANCTAFKISIATNVSENVDEQTAGITMCLEPNATYSIQADRVYPTVSDIHHYWRRVCSANNSANLTGNFTQQRLQNMTVSLNPYVNSTITTVGESDRLNSSTPVPLSQESTTAAPSSEAATDNLSSDNVTEHVQEILLNQTLTKDVNTPTGNPLLGVQANDMSLQGNHSMPSLNISITTPALNFTSHNSSSYNSSFCEILNCSWIEMCMPSIDVVDRCNKTDCPFTRKSHRSCLKVKMCKSPSTPISVFAVINTTISQIDQFEVVTRSVNDVSNLTLISYIPPLFLANCSRNTSDPAMACKPPVTLPPDACPQTRNITVVPAVNGTASATDNSTWCTPTLAPEGSNAPTVNLTMAEVLSTTPSLT